MRQASESDRTADGEPDVAELAASHGFGLAQIHAFVDGNKRTAFLAIGLFLCLNGKRLVTTQLDATETTMALGAGELDEPGLAEGSVRTSSTADASSAWGDQADCSDGSRNSPGSRAGDRLPGCSRIGLGRTAGGEGWCTRPSRAHTTDFHYFAPASASARPVRTCAR